MANMSYCRFRNTLSDLTECQEAMDDTSDLSKEEAQARFRMIQVCQEIVSAYGHEDEPEDEDDEDDDEGDD